MLLDILLFPFLLVYRIITSPFHLFKSKPKSEKVKIENIKQEEVAPVIGDSEGLTNASSIEEVRGSKKKHFSYKVKDQAGRTISNYFDAFSEVDVKNFLISQGYKIVQIKEVNTINPMSRLGSVRKIRYKDLNFFLMQLSTYIKSGITLVDSINILSKQTKKYNLKFLYQKLIFELNSGVSFSDALSKQYNVFPKLLINMVKTAELTGNLTEVLDDMAAYYKRADSNRKQIISAMTYPSVVLLFAVAILTFIILWVVPQFVGMYDQLGSELPMITQIIINISQFMDEYIFVIVGVIVIIAALLVILYKNFTSFKYSVQMILMKLPVIKNVIIYNEVIMFTSTFSSLIKHDVFITDSMEVLGKITENEIYKTLIHDAVINLSDGKGIAPAFNGHWAFPSTAYEMLLTGEKTGRLGDMLENVAVYYQEQQTNLITQMKSLIEPIMIVVLAVMVGIIVLSVIFPMFSMYSEIM